MFKIHPLLFFQQISASFIFILKLFATPTISKNDEKFGVPYLCDFILIKKMHLDHSRFLWNGITGFSLINSFY